MDSTERQQIIDLIKREVVPAIGCTEPVAVALCVAKATEILGQAPEKIEVRLSANVLKNAMGVGIPGTGMIGLPIAIALGAIAGKSAYGLEVLKDVTTEDVEAGRRYIDSGMIDISLNRGADDKLHIVVICHANGNSARAIISGGHTRFTHLSKNDEIILVLSPEQKTEVADAENDVKLTMRKVYDFAMTAPLDEISFIKEAGEINKAAAEMSFKGDYGHGLGKVLAKEKERPLIGNNIYATILSYTSAACDARMVGAMIPIMTNSGSGNQGISATVPVVIFARENGNTEEELIRALILSSLTVIYIKQSLGRLSALCGCVVATSGASCALTYLMGGDYEQVCYAIKNMIANLTGMICDGAKPSCAMKVASGVSTAMLSAVLAMEGKCVTSVEGIIDDDVDQCVLNMTRIGKYGMDSTDELVLDIMTNKSR